VELTNYSNSNLQQPNRARAAIYARVSSEDQAAENKVSIQQQLDACARYALAQGWEVVSHYIEPGITGETLDERPTLVSLLNEARTGALIPASKTFDVLVCYHSDRLARRGDIYQTLVELLENQIGVPVAPLNLNLPVDPLRFKPKSDDTRLMAHVLSGMLSQLDQRTRTRRMEGAKKAYVERGKWIAPRPPYGYYYAYRGDPTDAQRERTIEVDAVRFQVVQHIYQLLLYKDFSLHQIAKELTTRQQDDPENWPPPTPNNGRPGGQWYHATIRALLRNPFYGGQLQYGRTKNLSKANSVTAKRKVSASAPEEVTHGNHNVETPVTRDEWDRAQAILDRRGASLKKFFEGRNLEYDNLPPEADDGITAFSPRSLNTSSPLSGLLKCAHCGATYVLSVRRDHYYRQNEATGERVMVHRYDRYRSYYSCNRYRSGAKQLCPSPSAPHLNADGLLESVFDIVTQLVHSDNDSSKAVPKAVPTATATNTQLLVTITPNAIRDERAIESNRNRQERIEKRLDELTKEEKTLDRAMLAEAVTLEKYKELSGNIKAERTKLQTDLSSLQDSEKKQSQHDFLRERQVAFLGAWEELTESLYHTPTKGRGKGRRQLLSIAEWDAATSQQIRRVMQSLFSRIEVSIQKDPVTGKKTIELVPHLL
jgi:DNA invertase Pin-like site-specific DNA recombinase